MEEQQKDKKGGQDTKKDVPATQSKDTSIHPLLRGANAISICLLVLSNRFIPSYEGQTLSVYAAFSRLKHLVVQFTQMPFLAHLHI